MEYASSSPLSFISPDALQLDEQVVNSAITTLLMVMVLWAARVLLVRAVSRQSEILSPDQRRWTQNVKTTIWVLLLLGVVTIWAPQLQTAAVALTAFVVAIVIATKEVILCFTGALMRVSTAPFRMGDWITIDGVTGEVVDINPFSAKVQEIETDNGTYGFTGKIIQIPNSRYFSYAIENLSFLKQYKTHIFTIAFQDDTVDAPALLGVLRGIVEEHTAALQADAAQACKRIKRASHIALPDPAPQVFFRANDFNNLHFTVRAFLPTRDAAAIETRISTAFMSEVMKVRGKKAKK